MEALCASSHYGTSFLLPSSTSSNRLSRVPLRTDRNLSFLFLKVPAFRPCAVSTNGKVQISASFSRYPRRRRNRLREKLAPREAEVREIPKTSDADLRSPVDSDGLSHSRSDGAEMEGVGGLSTELSRTTSSGDEKGGENAGYMEKSSLSRDSVLWNKLESWVDQYKKDNEFWGIGNGPIFTCYTDPAGKINRVSVNEDEIVKRTRIGAFPFLEREEEEEEMDVSLKISRAKLMTKQILSGEYMLPKNSSIAKFVVEEKKFSVIDGFRTVIPRGRTFLKFAPRVGFTLLCGYFLFWAAKSLWIGDGRSSELTSEEKEMLRRKLKTRKEKNILVKGSVEVIQDDGQFPMESIKRPEMDRNELLKDLQKAKTSSETSFRPALSSKSTDYSNCFENKVKEIREMARKARELERRELQGNENGEVEDASFEGNSFRPSVSGSAVEAPEDIQVTDVETNNVTVCTQASSSIEKKDFDRTSLYTPSLSSKSPDTVKPKIMRSVKEAREYLSRKKRGTEFELLSHRDSPSTKLPVVGPNVSNTSENYDVHNDKNSRNNMIMNGVEYPKVELIKDAEGENIISESSSKETYLKAEIDINGRLNGMNGGHVENMNLPIEMETAILQMKNDPDLLTRNFDGQLRKHPSTDGVGNLSVSDDSETGESRYTRFKVCEVNADSDYPNGQEKYPGTKDEKTEPDSVSPNDEIEPHQISSRKFNSVSGSSGRGKTATNGPAKELSVSKNSDILTDGSHVLEIHTESLDADNNITGTSNIEFIRNGEIIEKIQAPESSQKSIGSDSLSVVNSAEDSVREKEDMYTIPFYHSPNSDGIPEKASASFGPTAASTISIEPEKNTASNFAINFQNDLSGENSHTEQELVEKENWLEENFQKFEPVVEKIRAGFRVNYMAAKEKTQEHKMINTDLTELGLVDSEEEYEWMKDDKLREIVFKVRDNELAGRDPFHLLNVDDQHAFFEGLEKKAEKVNTKLLGLHEWIHSRVENIDYGADGISLYDTPEKIMPRWKGPSVDKYPNFLNNSAKNQHASFTREEGKSSATNDDSINKLEKCDELPHSDSTLPYSSIHNIEKRSQSVKSNSPKTVIECSGGSSRIGKKGGKEHWQHTKKWSREFLELYNAETDPEIKSIMKDMGKDLDKWITKKEVKDVADLMNKRIPKKKRRFIEKKIDKLKREMDMFGPQAVVSKYREYSEEKEEDYLWWLDHKFILCIELYRVENDAQKVGFYSLEMAADLELDPKQYHVIAFEDPGDAKNFCYIMQAHLEMLGNGSAFVVAQPPKDAFREAKLNGFHVTVLRKGELKLNIDQPLEEVEEELVEIGSKMYHEKIMRERGVDMGALMKGVIASDRSKKRSSKRKPPKTAGC